jgi:hypothetical protein
MRRLPIPHLLGATKRRRGRGQRTGPGHHHHHHQHNLHRHHRCCCYCVFAGRCEGPGRETSSRTIDLPGFGTARIVCSLYSLGDAAAPQDRTRRQHRPTRPWTEQGGRSRGGAAWTVGGGSATAATSDSVTVDRCDHDVSTTAMGGASAHSRP